LYAGGIRVVVTLASEEEMGDLTQYGLEHLRADFPPVLLFSPGMRKAFIHESLPVWAYLHRQVLAKRPTLVHCFEGKDRTGALLAGYLVVYQKVMPEVAVRTLRLANPDAMTAQGYEDAVHLLQPGIIPDRTSLL